MRPQGLPKMGYWLFLPPLADSFGMFKALAILAQASGAMRRREPDRYLIDS